MRMTALTEGTRVLTTNADGDDFGLPLVSPVHKPDGRGVVERVVRRTCKVRGGMVVWFTDGTKTRVTHGRTEWIAL